MNVFINFYSISILQNKQKKKLKTVLKTQYKNKSKENDANTMTLRIVRQNKLLAQSEGGRLKFCQDGKS